MDNPNIFWNWFKENHHKFLLQQESIYPSSHHLKTHQLADQETLFSDLQLNLNNYCPNLGFVLYGSKYKNAKHQLIISTNANKTLPLKVAYLISKAPKLPRWTFTASIKPIHNLEAIINGTDPTYQFQDLKIKISDLMFLPTNYCPKSKAFDITIYLKTFWKHPHQLLHQAVAIMLED